MLGRWVVGGSSVLAAATLLACAPSSGTGSGAGSRTAGGTLSSASSRTSDDVPSRAVPSSEPTRSGSAAQCGSVPVSSGPLAALAHLAITAPVSASAGQSVPVSATVTSTSVVPRVITTPARSAVLVLQNGRVVSRGLGSASGPPVPLQLRPQAALPAQALPDSVRLTGCDTKGAGLPAGRYSVVAVLGYALDSLNAAPAGAAPGPADGHTFALVSAPVPITIG